MTYEQMGARWGCNPRAIIHAEEDAATTSDTLATVAERHGVPVGTVSAALRGRMRAAGIVIRPGGGVVVP